jgi:hypothetical protein
VLIESSLEGEQAEPELRLYEPKMGNQCTARKRAGGARQSTMLAHCG